MSQFKHFANMSKSLRVGAASGMDTQITLEPEAAETLAAILDRYEAETRSEIAHHSKRGK